MTVTECCDDRDGRESATSAEVFLAESVEITVEYVSVGCPLGVEI